jgi:hypothetical protein
VAVLTKVVKEQQQSLIALGEKVKALEQLTDKSISHPKRNE